MFWKKFPATLGKISEAPDDLFLHGLFCLDPWMPTTQTGSTWMLVSKKALRRLPRGGLHVCWQN